MLPMIMMGMTVQSQDYKKIHKNAIVVDTHNDIISASIEKNHLFDSDLTGKTHTDLQRMIKGGIDVQVFSIFCDGTKENPYLFANREIDTLNAWVNRNPKKMMMVSTPAQLRKAVKEGKIAAMIGVEGGHMIEDNLANLEALAKRGMRYMTLTWNNNNNWGTSAEYESGSQKDKNGNIDSVSRKKGLTDFGKQVVRKMNELGVMIDMSHVGEQTFWDAMAITTKPVIASHSDVYALAPVFRNLKDDQIKAIGKNGGVIQLNFYAAFLDSTLPARLKVFNSLKKSERDSLKNTGMDDEDINEVLMKKYPRNAEELKAPFHLLFDHMEYIIKLIGVDHVGLGGDFDGISITPQLLTDVTRYPEITKELVKRGYSQQDIYKILGGNFIRVFEANAD